MTIIGCIKLRLSNWLLEEQNKQISELKKELAEHKAKPPIIRYDVPIQRDIAPENLKYRPYIRKPIEIEKVINLILKHLDLEIEEIEAHPEKTVLTKRKR